MKDPDTLTYDKAMNLPDKAKWQEAAQVEIKALSTKAHGRKSHSRGYLQNPAQILDLLPQVDS